MLSSSCCLPGMHCDATNIVSSVVWRASHSLSSQQGEERHLLLLAAGVIHEVARTGGITAGAARVLAHLFDLALALHHKQTGKEAAKLSLAFVRQTAMLAGN